jgi:multidrug efflux pump subunit AcrA (membrane-fusion protein)
MRNSGIWLGLAISLAWAVVGWGQTLPTSARIEAVPIELTMPDRYLVSEVLEPIRRITLVAPADGVVRSLEARLGVMVRESQELAQLDRSEAAARLAIALAELKEKKAVVTGRKADAEIAQAQVEAAQARVDLAKLELDRCTLRAPFSGRITAAPVSAGQYVLKGTKLAELADVSSLTALQPVDRKSVKVGSTLTVQVEEQEVAGKVQAILPVPEKYGSLRELATPFVVAWVTFSNPKGDLEPGLRVRPGIVPTTPIAVVPKRALKPDDVRGSEGSMVQVIRNEYVTNVPVQVLGEMGPERTQIAGALRESDSLVVASSVALLPGTLIRFGEGAASRSVEGVAPSPSVGGAQAGIVAPGRNGSTGSRAPASGRAPGQAPGAGAAAPGRRVPNQVPPNARVPSEGSTPF